MNSKERIFEELRNQLRQHTLDEIRVKDILRNANVSRQTFYNYFLDKYDLAAALYEEDIKQNLMKYSETRNFSLLTESACAVLHNNRDYYKNLVKSRYGQNAFFDYWVQTSRRFLLSLINETKINEEIEIAIHIFTCGILHVFQDWLILESKISPQELAPLMIRSCPEVLVPYFQI